VRICENLWITFFFSVTFSVLFVSSVPSVFAFLPDEAPIAHADFNLRRVGQRAAA